MSVPTNATAKNIKDEKSALVKMIEGTLLVMNELVQLMGREIELVMERRFEEHKELLIRKQRLTMDYRTNMKTLSSQVDLLKQLPPEVIQAMKVAGQKLADVSERNAKFLRGAVMATQRLIQNVVSIVKQEVLPKPAYSNPNKTTLEAGLYSPTCKPVAVNRTA